MCHDLTEHTKCLIKYGQSDDLSLSSCLLNVFCDLYFGKLSSLALSLPVHEYRFLSPIYK